MITPTRTAWAIVALAALLAVAGARPHVGSWNDSSRLAAVESLVERGTLSIDGSPFADTGDRLFIRGHFYSDKPPVASALLAGVYRTGMAFGLPSPSRRPDVFCWFLTAFFCGGSLVVALLCLWRVGQQVGLDGWPLTAWLASAAFATFALAYTRHVNNGAITLAAVAAVCALGCEMALSGVTAWRLIGLGTLAGVGFNLDYGCGPFLVLACLALAWWPRRSLGDVLIVGLVALPWVAAALGLHYAIGGTIKPLNMVAEYSRWPGGSFDESNLTGFWRHTPAGFVRYAASMLFGKKGLVTHNLPLWLTLPALTMLWKRGPLRPALATMLGWCAASWLMYAALSDNSGGAALAGRWFVPMLAPLYLLLAVYLRERPGAIWPLLALSAFGVVMAAMMFSMGPWTGRMVPLLWPINALALASWFLASPRGGGMSVVRMRFLDAALGLPACWLLTLWRGLLSWFVREAEGPVRRILFIKLAEQGSTVLAQAALRAAIKRVGRENVFFLLFAENRAILDALELVEPTNVIAIDARGVVGAVLGSLAALWRVRSERIDCTIDLEFFARSTSALAYLSGAGRRVGFHSHQGEGPYRGELLTHRVVFNPYLHTSQAFHLLVEAADLPGERFPALPLSPPPLSHTSVQFRPTVGELASVWRLLGQHGGLPLVLINANASDLMPLRRWPAERYVELARRILAERADAVVAFTGAPAEAEAVTELVGQVGSPNCINLAGRTTLRELLALYTVADVLVTNDSGPAHFASLTPVNVVVLFGPETPKLFAALSPRTLPLWAGLACSPCISAANNRLSSCRDNLCMQAISVDEVFREVLRLLDARRSSAEASLVEALE
jgi:ADP-heptose:LPS heptosyltransferase